MKPLNSKVMTIANKLVTQGYNRANAMVKAWVLVKMPLVETKVAGVTYGKRQKAIEHLNRYSPDSVKIVLKREYNNSFDKNAVSVIVTVEGKGSYKIGYLPKVLACFIAPLLDTGKKVNGYFKAVKGLYAPYMNYGLEISLKV